MQRRGRVDLTRCSCAWIITGCLVPAPRPACRTFPSTRTWQGGSQPEERVNQGRGSVGTDGGAHAVALFKKLLDHFRAHIPRPARHQHGAWWVRHGSGICPGGTTRAPPHRTLSKPRPAPTASTRG